MTFIPLVTGFALGILFFSICHAFYYLRKNPTLPPLDGHVVVTRRDGSQHYRKLPTQGRADPRQIDIESVTGEPAV